MKPFVRLCVFIALGIAQITAWAGGQTDAPTTRTRGTISFAADAAKTKSIDEIADMLGKTSHRRVRVVAVDERPSVDIDGYAGYRIILREEHWEPKNPQQMASFVKETAVAPPDRSQHHITYSHMDIALFPLNHRPDDAIKDRIPWLKLDQQYYVKPIAMGTGHGYAWFGNIALFHQAQLRKVFGLTGGDDPLRLAIDGLRIDDKGSTTRRSMEGYLGSAGQAAVPYIDDFLRNPKESDALRARALYAIGIIPGERATKILREFYHSDNTTQSHGAAYGLTRPVYRREAKQEYLDMLRRRLYVSFAANRCVHFGWTEAVPILKDLYRHDPNNTRVAFEAMRKLEGRPVPQDLHDAETILYGIDSYDPSRIPTTDKIHKAIDVVSSSPDQEAAMVISVSMLLSVTKGGSGLVNESGKGLLTLLPEAMVKSYLSDLSAQDNRMKEKIERVMEQNFGRPR